MTNLLLHGATAQPQTVLQAVTLDTQFGCRPNCVQMFWSAQQGTNTDGTPKFTPFPISVAASLWTRGQLYLHTWAPSDWTTKTAWSPADILAGKYDAYLTSQARAIAAWAHPCFIRWCHEFNGSWALWNAWGPTQFVGVWQHVVDLFRTNNANNVTWIWGPNQVDPPGYSSTTAADKLAAWYPGSAYVDWLSWDAYNWGNARGGSWQSFAQINDLTYATLDALIPDKPMMLAEYGCNDTPGDKAAWITDALKQAPIRYPRLRALLYYPVVPASGTWPLTALSTAAYAAAIRAGPYAQQLAPMPPDSVPIRPLSTQWGDPTDLTTQLNQATATITENVRMLASADIRHTADADSIAQLMSDLQAAQQSAFDVANRLSALEVHIRAVVNA